MNFPYSFVDTLIISIAVMQDSVFNNSTHCELRIFFVKLQNCWRGYKVTFSDIIILALLYGKGLIGLCGEMQISLSEV